MHWRVRGIARLVFARFSSHPAIAVSAGSAIWSRSVKIGTLDISLPQIVLASGIALYGFAMPGDARFKLDALGFGVCHQIHTHSFTIAGHQLPLCARCTGMYLGAFSTLIILSRIKKRAGGLPTVGILVLLSLFFGSMVVDGFNSTFQTFGGGFWDSTNTVRLVTGTMSGLAIGMVFYPLFNANTWHRDVLGRQRVIDRLPKLLPFIAAAGVLVVLVFSGADWLLWPISLLSIGGLLALLTMSNTMLALLIRRKDGTVRTPHDLLTYVLIGLFISLIMLTLLSWGRASLAPLMANNPLGVPVLPGLP
ncbi:MAG: DUF2085 domain-containing protein [Chloroflexia bacterium]